MRDKQNVFFLNNGNIKYTFYNASANNIEKPWHR